ncbi:glutathione peroxidase [Liquorilactobacillus cacaonum]|uniref:Glutathione peroxidase n=1 Tax=Liquorilactobacillus cacaonum DSM 21116 TaxID=1423729 RepID=A0A0R2CX80_9LACO|nr:glutathione peroxidase [Liquorilactobacillus cacaonum]KRM92099.1 glutathione peroxidase [Liquorilactobacillus cacaonum DSM 21116]
MTNIYDYSATLENGTSYNLEKYHGKVLLLVNTATKCIFAPQFSQLEDLYQKYQKDGLEILGFPSNQFKQELSSSQQAAQACQTTYGVTFPMHQLANVNGKDANPIFTYLKDAAPGTFGKSIKWNFTKFLIGTDGQVVKRYAPKTKPKDIAADIESLLV